MVFGGHYIGGGVPTFMETAILFSVLQLVLLAGLPTINSKTSLMHNRRAALIYNPK